MNEIITAHFSKEVIDRYKRFEGYANHLYLDGPGIVTIGIGCALSNALSLDKMVFFHKRDNLIASLNEKISEYNVIKLSSPNQKIEHYKILTQLYTSDDEIMRLFEFRLQDKLSTLRKQFRFYDNLHKNAQEVMLDMAYNLGVSGLHMKFPRFCIALENKNYRQAAIESHRNNIQEERNKWAHDTLININKE